MASLINAPFFFIRMEDNVFHYDIRFDGDRFDTNGPVMNKKTLKWEPSSESMYPGKDGALQGDVTRHLLLEDGEHLQCDFKTTYK